MNTRQHASVAVLGSLNVDLVASVHRLPKAGETVGASGLRKLFGGKGANQAIAAARAGARVSFIGCVGDDADGLAYRSRLEKENIDVGGIALARGALTGTALIGVDAGAENLIIVAPAANGRVTERHVRVNRKRITGAGALLMQWEVPTAAIVEAASMANRAGVPVLLNPSPFSESFPWGEMGLDYVIVNEGEARQLFRLGPKTLQSRPAPWLRVMREKRIGALVLTRGVDSTLYLSASGQQAEVPTMTVKPVDTVGAGDAFAGAFTAFLARGAPIEQALLAGNCCGALATLQPGAQESVPSRRRLLTAMRSAKSDR